MGKASVKRLTKDRTRALRALRDKAEAYAERARGLRPMAGQIAIGVADRQAGMTAECLHILCNQAPLFGVAKAVAAAKAEAAGWIEAAKRERPVDARRMAPPVSLIEIEARKLREVMP